MKYLQNIWIRILISLFTASIIISISKALRTDNSDTSHIFTFVLGIITFLILTHFVKKRN